MQNSGFLDILLIKLESVFTTQQINNYWYESGTPTLLIKLLKEKDVNLSSLENFEADKNLLDSFEIENINVESLLFQTGYLSIKEVVEYDITDRTYVLNYPNKEVKKSLLRNILNNNNLEDF